MLAAMQTLMAIIKRIIGELQEIQTPKDVSAGADKSKDENKHLLKVGDAWYDYKTGNKNLAVDKLKKELGQFVTFVTEDDVIIDLIKPSTTTTTQTKPAGQ